MLLDLSNVLSEQHTPIDETVPCTMEAFSAMGISYRILSSEDVQICVTYVGKGRLNVKGSCRLVIEIPCDRCLKPVLTGFSLAFDHEIDSKAGTETYVDSEKDKLDENNYIDGYHLDVDRLLCNEILVGWPMKVLCSDSCKGICSVCGQNLNEGTCNCEDTGIDPRMSVIRDVFKNFKEV